jgi:hypothetical protein
MANPIRITTMHPEFTSFPKLARLNREIWITEKIDGTNAQVRIIKPEVAVSEFSGWVAHVDDHLIWAGSRNRWVTPEQDNHGWARWVKENAEELVKLGYGSHFGEWWGSGINRGYGLTKGEKHFSLFNTLRWSPPGQPTIQSGERWDDKSKVMTPIFTQEAPACCGVVPVLYRGLFETECVNMALSELKAVGSIASPGYMNPEGVVVFHTAANSVFKVTIKDDEKPKGAA